MGSKILEWIRSIIDLYAFWGLAMSAVTFFWAHVRHLKDVEVTWLCLSAFAVTIYITKEFRKWIPKKQKRYFDKEFKNQRVEIDNCEFFNCSFENVTFVYRGGIYRFANTKVKSPFCFKTEFLNQSASGAIRLQEMISGLQKQAEALGHKTTTESGFIDDQKKEE